MARPEWIEVGRISRPHGVQGEVRVTPSSDNPERYVPGARFHARPGRLGVAGPRLPEQIQLTVAGVRGEDDFPIVAFREIPDRDRAEAYCGYVLEVRSSQLPDLEEDEFYPFDLIGLDARDPSGTPVGRVIEALDSPAHSILIVRLDSGGQALVPFVKPAVPVVDVRAGYLVFDPALSSEVPGDGARPEPAAHGEDEAGQA
jgi:16S rRNA processing protein RimM